MSSCTDPRMNELLGAYLLGACAGDEADAMRDHLATCPVCASEAAELTLARDALLTVTPTRTAPGELKERVMAQVRADAELFAAAGGQRADAPHVPAPGARSGRRESRLRSWLRSPMPLATAAACALVLIAGGVLIGSQIGGDEGGGGARTVPGAVDSAMAPGGQAKLVVDDSGTAHLVVSGLPNPGARRVYQVWLQSGKQAPVPTKALFSVTADGSGEAVVPSDLKGVDRVMVTSEPEGGSKAPTRPALIAVTV